MKNLILAIIFISVGSTISVAEQVYPVAAEDGSTYIKKWYYCQKIENNLDKKIFETLRANGVEPIAIKPTHGCSHLQDIALFDKKGNALLMSDELINARQKNLNAVKSTFWDDAPNTKPIHITEDTFPNFRKMTHTFVEGGGLISGKFANGETYVIINQDNFKNTTKNFELTKSQAKEKIAKDLGIKTNNLFVAPMGYHLDLYVYPLPNGTLLMEKKENRKSKFADALETELKKDNRFKIIRVQGIFSTRTNFFNGFSGKNNKGEIFVITNKAKDDNTRHTPELENYWAKILIKHKIKRENIYFLGSYHSVAGIDCAGAISP